MTAAVTAHGDRDQVRRDPVPEQHLIIVASEHPPAVETGHRGGARSGLLPSDLCTQRSDRGIIGLKLTGRRGQRRERECQSSAVTDEGGWI